AGGEAELQSSQQHRKHQQHWRSSPLARNCVKAPGLVAPGCCRQNVAPQASCISPGTCMVERLDLSWPAAQAENRRRAVPGSIQTRGRAIRFTVLLTLLLGHFAATALAQVDPRTALLERAGWDAIASGQAHAAAEAFREALTADPKNGRLHLGAGMA